MTLVYTHLWTELLRMGVSWDEAMRMPWGVARMLFISRAEAYEASMGGATDSGDRYATASDIAGWV